MPIHRLINAAPRPLRPCAWVLALSLGVVWSSPAVAEGRDCEAEPTDMFIDYADLINCAIDLIGDIDVFRFTGGSGEAVRIQISGSAFFNSACFELFDPEGVPLGERTCGNRSADYRLERTGSHAILVSESENDEEKEYALLLDRIIPTSPASVPFEPNQVVIDELDVGDTDVFLFTGSTNDTVRIQISGSAFFNSACFELFDPEGVPVGERVCANRALDYHLERTGVHTILVTESENDEPVSYSLSHACIFGTCADGGLRPLQAGGCLAVKGVPLSNRAVRLTQPDEPPRTRRTDVRGCFEFDVVQGKPFDVQVVGPDVPE